MVALERLQANNYLNWRKTEHLYMTVGGFGWEFLFLFLGLIVSAISLIVIPVSFLFKFDRFAIRILFNIHGVLCVGHAYLFLKIVKSFF
ncbi:hypothetical protein [Xanthomonas albilineans]|uniref:hypothetical protein n=1 Tax=Xanthomonas albilineans TaxID=29447 RepID=UPI0012D3B088|nr:hypothetical protein [Xanthomonas albilineans]